MGQNRNFHFPDKFLQWIDSLPKGTKSKHIRNAIKCYVNEYGVHEDKLVDPRGVPEVELENEKTTPAEMFKDKETRERVEEEVMGDEFVLEDNTNTSDDFDALANLSASD